MSCGCRALLTFVFVAAVATYSAEARLPSEQRSQPEFLVLDLDGDGICLSSVRDGVVFRLDRSRAEPRRTAWTCAGGRTDPFIAWDRIQDGRIDGAWELIGGVVGGTNGFRFLGPYDGRLTDNIRGPKIAPDGRINASDWIYSSLILWSDRNHNGISEEAELESIEYAGVRSINLAVKAAEDTDASGSVITGRSVATVQLQGREVERPIVSVRLATEE
jgi:hypothetical protein